MHQKEMKTELWVAAIGWILIIGASTQVAQASTPAPLEHYGNTTYDPNTGLEWLDLSLTAGQSYNSVLGGWRGYTASMGFRFATRNEVIQLFEDAGAVYIGIPPSPSTANLPAATLTLSLLGTTLAQPDESRSWMFYNPSTEPGLPSSAYVPSAVFGVGSIFAGYPPEGFFEVPGIFPLRDYGSGEMASALVREVPEPAVAMFACTFLGLSLLARERIKRSGRGTEQASRDRPTWG